jgi:hypothetical protein
MHSGVKATTLLNTGLGYPEALFAELAQPLLAIDALRPEGSIDLPGKLDIFATVANDEKGLSHDVGLSTSHALHWISCGIAAA